MKKNTAILLVVSCLWAVDGNATHSADGDCGNGHLGKGEECSGSGGGGDLYAAPAPNIGAGIIGFSFAVGLMLYGSLRLYRCSVAVPHDR